MKRNIIATLFVLGGISLIAGCGGESGSGSDIPEEEKKEVQSMQTAVEELDAAADQVEEKKSTTKASIKELMEQMNIEE